MRSVALLALAVLAVTCGPSPDAKLPVFPGASGGSASGGSSGSGGADGGAGGRSNTGGSRVTGTGGRIAGTGGTRQGTGGRNTGSGGQESTSDAGVVVRRDGGRGTGGGGGITISVPDASRGGTGGNRDAARDVFIARDLPASDSGVIVRGTGGSGGRDAAPIQSDAPGGCMGQVVANDYTCGSAAPCSACESNGESKESECMKGVDCLANAGPSCDSNCQLACLNSAGDAVIQDCIKALQTAACSGPGC